MKPLWIGVGAGLLALAGIIVFLNSGDPGAAGSGQPKDQRPGSGQTTGNEGRSPEARRLRKESQETSEANSKAATDLELLWARSGEQEVLDALDKIGDYKKADEWQAIGGVLIQKASTEGRPEIIDYLLATGDAAPMELRMKIYAAALDNKAKGVADSAKLELQNLTSQKFESGEEARAWIKANQPEEEEEQE